MTWSGWVDVPSPAIVVPSTVTRTADGTGEPPFRMVVFDMSLDDGVTMPLGMYRSRVHPDASRRVRPDASPHVWPAIDLP
jgi:hypothetical protein